jgi:hypothetical protein
MGWSKVLNENKSHARAIRDGTNQLSKSFKAASGRSDGHNRKKGCFGR